MGSLNNRHLFFHSSGGRKSPIKEPANRAPGESLQVPGVSCNKNTNLTASGHHPHDLILPNYLHKGPVCHYSHIRGWGFNIRVLGPHMQFTTDCTVMFILGISFHFRFYPGNFKLC